MVKFTDQALHGDMTTAKFLTVLMTSLGKLKIIKNNKKQRHIVLTIQYQLFSRVNW